MNPAAAIMFLIGIVVAYFSISAGEDGMFGGSGPIATGPGTSEIRNPQPVSRGGRLFGGGDFFRPSPQPAPPASTPPPAPKPGESPWKDKVRIATVSRSGARPEQEYVIIRYGGGFFRGSSSGGEPLDVTGWRVASRKSSESIPRAFNIPEIDAAEQNIFLPPGGELIIVIGTPSYQRSFRENSCVGYLNQSHAFTPSLSSSCPDSRTDRAALLDRGFSGVCIDFIERIPTCRQPVIGFEQSGIGQACNEYVRENFSYVGCVKNFRDQKSFLKNAWRVSLRRTTKLFDPRHDIVTLRDGSGLLVDEFEY